MLRWSWSRTVRRSVPALGGLVLIDVGPEGDVEPSASACNAVEVRGRQDGSRFASWETVEQMIQSSVALTMTQIWQRSAVSRQTFLRDSAAIRASIARMSGQLEHHRRLANDFRQVGRPYEDALATRREQMAERLFHEEHLKRRELDQMIAWEADRSGELSASLRSTIAAGEVLWGSYCNGYEAGRETFRQTGLRGPSRKIKLPPLDLTPDELQAMDLRTITDQMEEEAV